MRPSINTLRTLGLLGAFALASCGPAAESGTDSGDNPSQQLVYVPDLVDNAQDFQSLDHDGGASDLNLDWVRDSARASVCPGTNTFEFAIRNDSGHTPGRNLWFTILYYRGQEYVNSHTIVPQAIDVPVGATQDVRFTVDVKDEFASADGRDIHIALIVQTDNPNLDDPDAFFRRLWLNLTPREDCGVPEMTQPARLPLNIHSVTCPNRNVRLQVGTSLITGTPVAEMVAGEEFMTITNPSYYAPFGGRDFWWADLFSHSLIPPGREAVISFGSSAADTMFFRFTARVECGGEPGSDMPISPPPPDDGTPPDDGVPPDDTTPPDDVDDDDDDFEDDLPVKPRR
jgi:hypothetical protein